MIERLAITTHSMVYTKKESKKRNFMIINNNRLIRLYTFLQYFYGITALVIGVDKFFYCIVDWNIFVGPWVYIYLPPLLSSNIVPLVGIIEIAAGILVLSTWVEYGSYIVAAWIGVIIINLCTIGGMYDIILRDIAIAVGYITLGVLTPIQKESQNTLR
jgi:hypothetical protein